MTNAIKNSAATRSFAEQLMGDALFLRGFIAARGLYSKEVLAANKALLAAIEKAEEEAANSDGGLHLGADTENALLTAMSDLLRHLQCTKIDDLRRADTTGFKTALSAGRIVVFSAMLICITLALPLTLAFNQLTAMSKEIEASLADEVVQTHLANVSNFWSTNELFKELTAQRQLGMDAFSKEEWEELVSNYEEASRLYDRMEYRVTMQRETWRIVAVPPTILTPLFRILDALAPAEKEKPSDSAQNQEKTIAAEIAVLKSGIVPVKRKSEALTFLLNNAILPLLYGSLGSAVFLSRRYMSAASQLLSSNPVTDALMRIGLGGMAGLIVGWFQTPDGIKELTSTPFVLAFVAGFSIDIVFSLLERVVAAFDFRKTE